MEEPRQVKHKRNKQKSTKIATNKNQQKSLKGGAMAWSPRFIETLLTGGDTCFKYSFKKMSSQFGRDFVNYIQVTLAMCIHDNFEYMSEGEFIRYHGIPEGFYKGQYQVVSELMANGTISFELVKQEGITSHYILHDKRDQNNIEKL